MTRGILKSSAGGLQCGAEHIIGFVFPDHDNQTSVRTLSKVIDKAARRRALFLFEAFEVFAAELYRHVSIPIQFGTAALHLHVVALLLTTRKDSIRDQFAEIALVRGAVPQSMDQRNGIQRKRADSAVAFDRGKPSHDGLQEEVEVEQYERIHPEIGGAADGVGCEKLSFVFQV